MMKVREPKKATVKYMLLMAENLRKKFNCYVTVSASVCGHRNPEEEYGLYIASDDEATHIFRTWQKLLSYYHKRMGDS